MRKIIAVFNDNKIITRTLDIDLVDTIKGQSYKIFANSLHVQKGENIGCYDDSGSRYSNSILQEKGLLVLAENEVLDGENIREKTDIEKYNDNPSSDENIIKVIDTDEQGNECLREKTMFEKYEAALVSKDDYNKWADEARQNEYSNTTDKMNARLQNDTDLSEDEKVQLQSDIDNKKIEIKQKYPKVLRTQ